ncbi:MAG TPA: signal peptidase II [Dehalococcoidia bacterium]|nr:signal peptidase II [Dehalococcoidia bacterium]
MLEFRSQLLGTVSALGSGRGWRRHLIFLSVVALVVGIDQASKQAVRSFMDLGDFYPSRDWPLRLHYVENSGAAFGILQDQTLFLVVSSLIGLAAILFYYLTQGSKHWAVPLAMGMMLGGAAGNLLDRVRFGHVTDFLDFPNYPSFNVADSSIVIAVAMLIVVFAFSPARPPEGQTERPESSAFPGEAGAHSFGQSEQDP